MPAPSTLTPANKVICQADPSVVNPETTVGARAVQTERRRADRHCQLFIWGPSLLPAAKIELLAGALGMAGAVVALVVLFAF